MYNDYRDFLPDYCPAAVLAAYDAGEAIMAIYDGELDIEYKADQSPLTAADKASHELIMARLQAHWDLPVLSEESREVPYDTRRDWLDFWLVDPLDGTKEFIKHNGEFTVNIALIHDGLPVLGVVYSPALGLFYLGAEGTGARMLRRGEHFRDRDDLARALATANELPALPMPPTPGRPLSVVASRSHSNNATEAFIADLEKRHGRVELLSIGSSLKLCLVADGSADVYPRIAPTMEWDTAAAQAVATAAGCRVVDFSSDEPLRYNKMNLTNPFFVVYGPSWPRPTTESI
ncbi:MAG: 3'(2'),5'-bisphosphate nucleotidase CysQ [Lentisphaeria bacterium]|nr:3'(2'),5'-bisphosphate nucleotidase CysQ [Lentisphaeria bacterium]